MNLECRNCGTRIIYAGRGRIPTLCGPCAADNFREYQRLWDAQNRPNKNAEVAGLEGRSLGHNYTETEDGRLVSVWHAEEDARRNAVLRRDYERVRVLGGRYHLGGDVWLPSEKDGGVQVFPDVVAPLVRFVPEPERRARFLTLADGTVASHHADHKIGEVRECYYCLWERQAEGKDGA